MSVEFARRVERQVERLSTCSSRALEAEVTRTRLNWLASQGLSAAAGTKLTPRQAFRLLFSDYMGLDEKLLPIVAESADEIVWRSQNPCPTLEACTKLGLDTRKVCRSVYEKSTQAFLSAIDPELRFLRSYEKIRPYADYCEERIVRVEFAAVMAEAIEEAKESRRTGNKGYGALVVRGRDVLGCAHDTASSAGDPSLHAELNAIRQAARATGDPNLSGCVVVSTCEPCPMCSSLAVWANVTSIVYGASIEETVRLGKARIEVGCREIVEKSPVAVEIIGGVARDECLALYG